MKNRPTEPGYWWYEDHLGNPNVAKINEDMDVLDDIDFTPVDIFERFGVSCWLGKAIPPNDCNTCRWLQSCDDMEPCNICEPTCYTEWEKSEK